MAAGISSIHHVLGGTLISNEHIKERHDFDLKFIEQKLGIQSRYAATEEQATSDLAIEAGRGLLEKTNLDVGDVGLLCVATQTPDYQLPHTAALVQDALGLSKNVASFDLSLGCSGYVYGVGMCCAFMEANQIEKGLLITAESYSKIMDPSDRATAPLFSDAAAATLLSSAPAWLPMKGVYSTDGSGADKLIMDGGGSRHPDKRSKLFMDGRAIFNFMMKEVPSQVQDCLDKNSVSLETIDKFVFHQANSFMLDSLVSRMRLPKEKVVYALRDCANTVSSSIPIAMESLEGTEETVLISGFGVGLSWATNILQRVENA